MGRATDMQRSLEGLALGDAFGQQFCRESAFTQPLLDLHRPPPGRWPWTDDTAMALAIAGVLRQHGTILQDELAMAFARTYAAEPWRGYGAGQRRLLERVAGGAPWRDAARELFGGEGSCGNGCAMRIAPLGAFFAGDLPRVVQEARLATEVTHAHAQGVAGGIAAAVAAALAAGGATGSRLLQQTRDLTPPGEVREGLEQAASLAPTASAEYAAHKLGNGSGVLAADTVPFCVWCASRNLGSVESALWQAVSVGGDRDTVCAIVGGIVASAPGAVLPPEWLARREPLPVA